MIMFQTENLNFPMPEIAPDSISSGKQALQTLKGLSFDDAISKIANGLVSFGFKLMIAILVFYVGRFIIRKIYQGVYSVMLTRKVDPSLTTFVLSLIKMVLYFILIITIIGILGIETGSFLALFASAGVAIGMALSGTLQNFAGGVLILLLKPYKVGDYIEAQGYAGTVKEIQIFHTIINTTDNKAIIIPNGGLSTSSINNYSLESYRRVDWTVALSYGTDYEKAREAILEIVSSDDRVVLTTIDDDMKKRDAEAVRVLREDTEAKVMTDKEDDSSESGSAQDIPAPVKKIVWWKRWIIRRRKERIIHEQAFERKIKTGIHTDDPRPPFIGLAELVDSSINIAVRVWTNSVNYWPLFFEMNRRFYTELPQKGFSFPFPQMDVHLDGSLMGTTRDS